MPTCQGKTKDGRPCSRSAEDGALYCWQHKPDEPATRLEDADGKPLPEVYELLAKATPEEKTDIVLRLIEEHPEGRLELPEVDGVHADLGKVDLSRDTLKAHMLRSKIESPNWWYADSESDDQVEGADLRDADLQGANLTGAKLQGAVLWGANLQGVALGWADLSEAQLNKVNLQGANLLSANLQRASLQHANLREAYMGHPLESTNLEEADLAYADLRDAELWGTNLVGANLSDAKLQGVDLTHAIINHVYISGAWLDTTKMYREQFGEAIEEELAREYEYAKEGYQALKRNFDDLGDYNAASWAYVKERKMEKAMNAPWRAPRFYGMNELGVYSEDQLKVT